ncbi:MAG TPA: transglutaminase family protein [Polyangiaceae bacterium]|nr:transglutaminase family protein [Polyangiaceae bacterium]
MTVYRVRHLTSYVYESPVLHAHHLAHLRPRRFDYQTTRRTLLEITPAPRDQHRQEDYFGNDCDVLEVLSPHERFDIVATSEVEVRERQELARVNDEACKKATWQQVAEQLARDARLLSPREFCFDSPLVRVHPMLRDYASPSFPPGRPLLESLLELNDRVHDEFSYEPASTDVSTPLAQVMRERRGVCQDFAHVMVGCLRSLGLAARYVSGYLETMPPPGQPRLVGSDASHAWVGAFVPELGWLDLDPTNALLPHSSHITVAHGRDFSDVSPLKGVVLGGGRHTVEVGVDVQRLPE